MNRPTTDLQPTQVMPAAPLVLTASDRLARNLIEDHSLQARRDARSVWEAPRIASLPRWLIDTWTSTWPDAQLLSATQELALWVEAVERDEAGRGLLSPLAAAREARRADQLIRRHGIDLERAPAWQDEHHAFRRWRAQVLRRMAQSGWITGADLPGIVARLIRVGAVPAPEVLHLRGFVVEPIRAERELFEALEQRGTRIEHISTESAPPRIRHLSFTDDEAQVRFLADELRERLRSYADHALPPPRIVVALPDPEARRDLIESVFRDLLAPWAASGEGSVPWRWERGRPLAEQPWVDAMLAILQIAEDRNAPQLVSRVLLSTVLWPAAQARMTAAADLKLRESGLPVVGLARLCDVLAPALRPRFESLRRALRDSPRRALPSDWSLRFRQRLDALGWPGPAALDSAAFQAVKSAGALLDRLATLDSQLDRVPESTAREWLGEFARSSLFLARVEHTQPVLIASFDEAAALQGDALYLLDASATQWPRPARPTPFIPIETLRAAAVVEAIPERLLEQARRVSAALLHAATDVLVGFARVDARGAEIRASPLFGETAAWRAMDTPGCIGALERELAKGSRLQPLEPDPIPPVDAAEQAGLRPDGALFRHWFESPFFAFCRYRLGIDTLPQPSQGLDARVQGTLVHELLKQFWGDVADSAALAALGESDLQVQLETLLDGLLPRHLPAHEVGAATVRLERARVLDVVTQWVNHERRRVDPFEVVHREVPAAPMAAGLQLRLRLDRVDKVITPTGERWLVIDYKTGRDVDTSGWKAETLKEPQLPLYASHAALIATGVPQVDGICFGHLKDGHPALVAMTNWRKRLIGPDAGRYEQHWDERLAEWRMAIDAAAQGFLAGEAWVSAGVSDRSPNAELLNLASGSGREDQHSE
ncbi:MAG: PD-(D/E)XK nuclease family protein [Panacagrimonas sp.]